LWRPVVSIRVNLWRGNATEPHEKNDVILHASKKWGDYFRASSAVLGEPTWAGGAGMSGFPDPPYEGVWRKPRAVNGNPLRMAYWEPREQGLGEPYVVLTQAISDMTWQADGGASGNVTIKFMPPSPIGRRK